MHGRCRPPWPVPLLLSCRTKESQVVALYGLVSCAGGHHQRIPPICSGLASFSHYRSSSHSSEVPTGTSEMAQGKWNSQKESCSWNSKACEREWMSHTCPPEWPKENLLSVPQRQEEDPQRPPSGNCLWVLHVPGASVRRCLLFAVPQRQLLIQ